MNIFRPLLCLSLVSLFSSHATCMNLEDSDGTNSPPPHVGRLLEGEENLTQSLLPGGQEFMLDTQRQALGLPDNTPEDWEG